MAYTTYVKVIDGENQTVRKDVQEAITILHKYFCMLQDGTHIFAVPDPFFPHELSSDRIDRIIAELDADFEEHEKWRIDVVRWNIEKMPEFSRLCEGARRCMVQELVVLWEYQDKHPDEYLEKWEIGVWTPELGGE